jgi:hypothetical protein
MLYGIKNIAGPNEQGREAEPHGVGIAEAPLSPDQSLNDRVTLGTLLLRARVSKKPDSARGE